MSAADISAARFWRAALPFDGAWLGIYPAWNAIVGLDRTGAEQWQAIRKAALERMPAPKSASSLVAGLSEAGFLRLPLEQKSFHPPTVLPHPDVGRTIALDGRAVRCEVQGADLAAAVAESLGAAEPSDLEPTGLCVARRRAEGEWIIETTDAPPRIARGVGVARGLVIGALIRLAGTRDPRWFARLHAACLQRSDGRAVLLCGQAGSGKSTLALDMVARGYRLISDDITPLTEDLLATPLALSPSAKSGAWDHLAPSFPTLRNQRAHDYGTRHVKYVPLLKSAFAECPAQLAAIIMVRFVQGTALTVTDLSPREALALFLNEDSYIDLASPALTRLLRKFEQCPKMRLDYARSDEAIRHIETLPRSSLK